MIVNIVIDGVESRVFSRDDVGEFHTDIKIDSAEFGKDTVSLGFVWDITYSEKVGYIKLDGSIVAREAPEKVKRIREEWGRSKMLPADFAQEVVNSVNYDYTAHAISFSNALQIAPPLKLPSIMIQKA